MSSPRLAEVATTTMSVALLLRRQIEALQAAGYDVTAVCGPDEWADRVRAADLKLDLVPMTRRITPFRDAVSWARLRRAFRDGKYDVVLTHTPKAGLLAPSAARAAGVPLVVHVVHGLLFHDDMPRSRRVVFRAAERATALPTHGLLFQSQEDLETARRLGFRDEERLRYLGNGIDTKRFDPSRARPREEVRAELGIRDDELVVGIVARLTYEKGFRELFDAIPLVRREEPRARFVIIGPFEPDQSDAVTRADLDAARRGGGVDVLGLRHDLVDLYPAMDLFALPSHREGMPRALMEASCMRVACVATAIRGCREVIVDGETGRLVPVRDAPALARAIVDLLRDPTARAKLGEAARRRVLSTFDEDLAHARLVESLRVFGELGSRR